jgi:DNA-binding LytR/AlgR family response regulator
MILDFKLETKQKQKTNNGITTISCPYCNNHATEPTNIASNDWIIKPIKDLNFNKQFQSTEINKKSYIFIKLTDAYQKIMLNAILFIKSEKNYLTLKTTEKEYRFRSTIKDFIIKLPENFIQTNQSFIINCSKIENFNSNSITLSDNMKISVSVLCKKEVLVKLKHQLL